MRTARLGDHVAFLSGFAFKSNRFNTDGDGLPLVRIRDVLNGKSDTFYSGDYDERYVVHSGDCLIGMDGEFNLAFWLSGKALLNQRVCKVDKVSPEIDRGYLARFLTLALKQIEAVTPFVTVKHLSVKTLSDTLIPLPTLPEQKRIAAILDAADALRAKRRESIEQLDSLVQATFLEMFGDPRQANSKGSISTQSQPMGQLTRIRTGKLDANAADEDGVYPFFTCAATPLTINTAAYDCKAVLVAGNGDLNVKYYEGKFNAYQRTYIIESLDESALSPRFLFAFLDLYVAELRKMAIGGVIKYIKLPYLKDAVMQLPSPHHQTRFASIVESIEQQKTRLKAHLAELDTLFAALQSRAFNGELVA